MGHGFCMTLPSTGKKFHGFSLMEVMIVVVIIGILAALAYPNLEKYLKRARQTEAKTNLSAIYTAQKIYLTLHQSILKISMNLTLAWLRGSTHTLYRKHRQAPSKLKPKEILMMMMYWIPGPSTRIRIYAIPSTTSLQRKVFKIFEPSSFCLLYTSPSPRDKRQSRMPSSA